MKSYDALARDLMELYSRAHPEMTTDEVSRYVIGVLSPVGHVIYTAQMECGEEPVKFERAPLDHELSVEGRSCADDLVWHPMHRCWVKIRPIQVGKLRKDFIGCAITQLTAIKEAFGKRFGYEPWTFVGTETNHKLLMAVFASNGQKVLAWIHDGKLLTKEA